MCSGSLFISRWRSWSIELAISAGESPCSSPPWNPEGTAAPPVENTPFPVSAVELAIEGVKLTLLGSSNSADKTVYYFQWKTTDFPDGKYLVRPRALGTNGFVYQYGFGEQMMVANSSG